MREPPWRIGADGLLILIRLTPRGGRDAIDGITPMLKELASNTESIINRLNETPKLLRHPQYVQYLKSNAQLANDLATAIRNVVDYDDTKTKMEELEARLLQK